MMRATMAALTGAMLVGACYTSPKPQAIPEATSLNGELGTVTLAYGRTFSGELLAVTDTSWVMLVGNRVSMVRSAALQKVLVPSTGDIAYSGGKATSATRLEAARHAVRFPYGISPDVMSALLAKSGQQAPDDLEKVK